MCGCCPHWHTNSCSRSHHPDPLLWPGLLLGQRLNQCLLKNGPASALVSRRASSICLALKPLRLLFSLSCPFSFSSCQDFPLPVSPSVTQLRNSCQIACLCARPSHSASGRAPGSALRATCPWPGAALLPIFPPSLLSYSLPLGDKMGFVHS